jgi:O-antigen/teichoic acid export membrane protein
MIALNRYGVVKPAISLFDQGIVSLTPFIASVLIGRTNTPAEFGLYVLGVTVVAFLVELQTALISSPYMVYSPRLRGMRRARYAGGTLLLQLALGGLAAVVLGVAAIALTVFDGGGDGLARVLGALSIVILFILLRDFIRRVAMARLEMEGALVLDMAVSALQLAGLAALAMLGALNAPLAHIVIGAACAGVSLVWMRRNRHRFEPSVRHARRDLKLNWSMGRWLFASGVLWALGIHAYPWILAVLHGTEAAGVWGACLGALSLVVVPQGGITNWLGPRIAITYARGGPAPLRRFVFRAAAGFAAGLAILCSVLIVFADRILAALYGEIYASAAMVLAIMAIAVVARGAAFCFSRGLFAIERADVDFWINLIPVAILGTFGVWAISTHGAEGAAVALLVSHGVASAVRGIALAVLLRPLVAASAGEDDQAASETKRS